MTQKRFSFRHPAAFLLLFVAFLPFFRHNVMAASSRGTLRIGFDVKDMDNFDPHFANEPRERAIAEMLFNRLIRYRPGTADQPEPDLAEHIPKPKIVSGRQTWSFVLRKGVMFHPGPGTDIYELTAEDAVWSLEKAAFSVSPIYAGDYSGMSVRQTGRYTFDIIWEKNISVPLFISKLASCPGGFIVGREAVEAAEYEQFKTHPVGTGPFMFDHLRPEKKIGLRANRQYFRECPRLARVDVFFLSDDRKRERYLRSGKLHLIDGPADAEWIEKMGQEDGVTVDTQGIGETVMLHFNTSEPPLSDMRVRRAIAYALDRDAFLDISGKSVSRNIFSPVPEELLSGGLEWEKIEKFGLDYAKDIEKSKQLLAEAGYPEGFELSFVTSKRPIYLRYYELLKEQLEAVGIRCDIRTVAHSSMHTRIRQGENPIVVYIAWRSDADAVLTRFFHSDAMVVRGAKPDTNFSQYTKADKLIEAARSESDPQEQIRLWEYTQLKLLDHMAVYPLQYISAVHARRAEVKFGHSPAFMEIYPHITERTRLAGD